MIEAPIAEILEIIRNFQWTKFFRPTKVTKISNGDENFVRRKILSDENFVRRNLSGMQKLGKCFQVN